MTSLNHVYVNDRGQWVHQMEHSECELQYINESFILSQSYVFGIKNSLCAISLTFASFCPRSKAIFGTGEMELSLITS